MNHAPSTSTLPSRSETHVPEARPRTRTAFLNAVLIALAGVATAMALVFGATMEPDNSSTTPPKVTSHSVPDTSGVSYTVAIPPPATAR